jgi:dTDP-4-dehydrorhamnose 3,5-epimerase
VSFTFTPSSLPGLVLIEPKRFDDDRGFFMGTYKESEFFAAGITERFVQDNHSRSRRGVLRGLHFQREPHAQGKLVRVIAGAVWDVAVDLRPASPTRAQWFAVELSAENQRMLYIPPGFAHGFLTLSEEAELVYKCSSEYDKASDGGLRWDDPDLAIAWPVRDVIVSSKDAALPYFTDLKKGELQR